MSSDCACKRFPPSAPIIRAVVHDLGGGEVEAKIVQAPTASVSLASNAVVQFVDPKSKGFGSK